MSNEYFDKSHSVLYYILNIYRHVIGKNNVIGKIGNITYILASVSLTNFSLSAKSNKTDAKL